MNNWDPTILIVDDSEDDVFMLRFAIKRAGITNVVEVARNGREAIVRLAVEASPPGLVLLDLNMPGTNGFEVLAWRTGQLHLRAIPFVVFTSSDLDIDRKKVSELGATEFHVKTHSMPSLIELMQKLCRRWLLDAKCADAAEAPAHRKNK